MMLLLVPFQRSTSTPESPAVFILHTSAGRSQMTVNSATLRYRDIFSFSLIRPHAAI